MTGEEWKKRMENAQYNDLEVTTHKTNKPYVFISYKSDSWELVLTEIVYTLQKKYGLRVYFDKSFNDNNNIWTEQFPQNMKSHNCKAVLAFVDNKYYSSYATLLELMYSQTREAARLNATKNDLGGLPVIPVNLETIKEILGELGEKDTGLGVETFDDRTQSFSACTEKNFFDDIFYELKKKELLVDAEFSYKGKNLSKAACADIMGELYKKLKVSDNIYKSDMDQKYFYDSLANTIKSVAPEVFDDSNVDLSNKVDELATDKNKVQEIKWRDFETIQSFSYNYKYFNTSNAQQAYAAIVDVIKQNNPLLDTKSIICGETPFFVKLAGGSELDMINGGYGNILKNVPEIKNTDIKLYSSKLENAQQVKAYEILKREKVALNPEYVTDDIKMFNTYFTKLSKEYSESWTKSNGQGKTPSISMDIKLRFECDYLGHHTIKGYKWKPIFTEMMNYFFEISGESYYDYAVKLCDKLGITEPLVINADVYEKRIKDKSRYASVAENNFYFLNSYSAKDIVKAIIKQISMYYEYLKAKQINVDISKVYVDYKIDDKEISNMMMDIRKNIGDLQARPISPTSELVSFNSEPFSEFVLRFLRISKAYKEDWKRNNKGNTPAIPFANIKIYMSENIVKNSEITADNWKPLFNKVMGELCVSSNGEYCEYRNNEEARKNIKTPAVVTKSDYEEGRIPRERYQPIAEGQYYFFNSYGAPELIKALRDEIKMYIDFVNRNKGTQAGMEEIFISYSLPKGEDADMFS